MLFLSLPQELVENILMYLSLKDLTKYYNICTKTRNQIMKYLKCNICNIELNKNNDISNYFKCLDCNKMFCKGCQKKCLDCSEKLCIRCTFFCECDEIICKNCKIICQGCREEICKNCKVICDYCNFEYCLNCLVIEFNQACNSCEMFFNQQNESNDEDNQN